MEQVAGYIMNETLTYVSIIILGMKFVQMYQDFQVFC